MYDFYFGTKEDIEENEEKFLLLIKRLLPKWCNSIPDSEYIALFRIGDNLCKEINNPVLVETGTGSSSIIMAYLALKYDGICYTWDINGEKGSLIRTVMNETLCNYFDKNINNHWKLIAFDSLSEYLGLNIMKELQNHIDMCFLDSKHTLNILLKEIDCINPLLKNGSVIAIDDGNYNNNKYEDEAYINLFRKKIGLNPISVIDNKCEPFYIEVENHLKDKWKYVEHIEDFYKDNYKDDIFFTYYSAEITIRSKEKMEKLENLEHRFDAWRVDGKKRD